MDNNFKRGLLKTFAYYVVGFITALAAYWLFGWEYKHAPGLHHLIGLLFLLGGAFWLIYSLLMLLTGLKSKVNLGTLTVHLVVVFGFVAYILISIYAESTDEAVTGSSDILTISEEAQTKTASVVYGLGNTVLLKAGDSILIDQINVDSNKNR